MQKILYAGLFLLLSSCVALKQKKSADYYYKNEKNIKEILKLYKGLYRTQSFPLGFRGRSFKHVGMGIKTDTVRYALNNELSQKTFLYAIHEFNYDTTNLLKLFVKMHEIKCIWLGTEQFYYKGKEEEVVFLSFRSVKFGNPFLDRKYYMLVLFDPAFITPETELAIIKHGYKKVKGQIYYTIAEKFR